MRIGIDVDDTLAKTSEYAMPYAHEYDKTLRGNGPVNKTRKYLDSFDWNEEEFNIFRDKYLEKSYENLPSFEGASEILKKLKNDGHELYIITARDERYFNDPYNLTKAWLDDNDMIYDKILTSSLRKGEVCEENKIDIMIDDSFGQASYIAENNHIPVLMPVDKHNKEKECHGIIKVHNWEDIYQKICELNNK